MAGCQEGQGFQDGKRKKADLGGGSDPLVADGLQISSPSEAIKQRSGERGGINLGSRKSWTTSHIATSPLESINSNTVSNKRKWDNAGYGVCVP